MKPFMTTALVCLFAFSSATLAATPEATAEFKQKKESAEKEYTEARLKCDAMKGHPKDVCIAEAKAARIHVVSNAKATLLNTEKARAKSAKEIANADYAVAKAMCGSQVGNDKDVCIKKADAVRIAAIANASAVKKVNDARSEASSDKQDANYEVALEKCNALVGTAKDMCVSAAKTKFKKM